MQLYCSKNGEVEKAYKASFLPTSVMPQGHNLRVRMEEWELPVVTLAV